MNNTSLSNAAFKPGDDYAFPHSKVDGKFQAIDFVNLDNAGPAGSINSSAAEMAKWITLQLARGKFPNSDKRLFTEERSGEMWSPQTILPTGESSGPLAALRPKFADYALGWGIRDYHGRKLVGHTGGVAGFVSRVMLVPEENLGVVILTNAEQTGAFDSILFHILDHYFALPATDWITDFKAADEADQKEADEITKKQNADRAAGGKPSLLLEKYAGVYTDPWYGPVTIRSESGKLIFTMDHTPRAVADLQPWQYDTFKAHFRDRTIEDAFVTFTLKPDGAIDHFTMVAVSPLADFSFDYQDLYFTPQKPAR
jgi:CubicO group peptidase (beta-lactamase class C family)